MRRVKRRPPPPELDPAALTDDQLREVHKHWQSEAFTALKWGHYPPEHRTMESRVIRCQAELNRRGL